MNDFKQEQIVQKEQIVRVADSSERADELERPTTNEQLGGVYGWHSFYEAVLGGEAVYPTAATKLYGRVTSVLKE